MKKPWVASILCFLVGLLIAPVGAFTYLRYGHPPVAVDDPSFPFEKQIVRTPLHARMEAEMQQPTLLPTEQNLLAGATVYREQCSFCHGLPGNSADIGRNMFPSAPQLWTKHRTGVVGVSDDPAGETYWRVKNGIRLTGMPSYQKLLTNDQLWQVSLLLHAAAQPLPAAVQAELAAK